MSDIVEIQMLCADAQREVRELRAENEELKKLAYVGEHHFPDLTWKARCDELRAENEEIKTKLAWLYNITASANVTDDDKEWVDDLMQAERDRLDHFRKGAQEATRLRAALTKIRDGFGQRLDPVDIAAAALAQSEGEKP